MATWVTRSHLLPFTRAMILITALSSMWANLRANDQAEKNLARAEKLAWLHNWNKARPLYEVAEKEFAAAGDAGKATLCRVGRILASIYTTDSEKLLTLLDRELEQPLVEQDQNLKLR